MKKARHIVNSLLLTLAFNGAAVPVMAEAANSRDRQASIVIDAASGKTLHEQDGDQQLYSASTTKIMTAYLTFKALKAGKLSLDQKIPVSLRAAGQPRTNLSLLRSATETVVVTTRKGKKIRKKQLVTKQGVRSITVRNALGGLMVHSANDAAVVLSEAVSGSEKAFVAEMNRTADALGMTQTQFFNPNGLPNPANRPNNNGLPDKSAKADPNNKASVRDMAFLARAVLHEFPEYAHFLNMTSFKFNGVAYKNYNNLLGVYPGADCCKTGFISASRYNLVASAKQGDTRVIGVVFGSASSAQRAREMTGLLDAGFEKLEKQPPVAPPPVPPHTETAQLKPEQAKVPPVLNP